MARSVSRLTTATCRSRGIRRQPVPSSLLLLATGVVGLAIRVRRNEGVKSWPLTGTAPSRQEDTQLRPIADPKTDMPQGARLGVPFLPAPEQAVLLGLRFLGGARQ